MGTEPERLPSACPGWLYCGTELWAHPVDAKSKTNGAANRVAAFMFSLLPAFRLGFSIDPSRC
jgi:hypothetical protein